MFCPKCGAPIPSSFNFCRNCGASIAPAAPESTGNYYSAPYGTETMPAAVPSIPTKVKVLGFIGMGLGIEGLAASAISILYTLAFMFDSMFVGFVWSMFCGIFITLPCCVAGFILCRKSMAAGNTLRACSVGHKLCIAGLIVSGVMLFMGLIDLFLSI